MTGDLEQTGDRWRLRFERELSHPADKVWRAITEPEHLQTWFPQRIVGDWEVGARLRFEFEGEEMEAFDGEVLVCEPPTLLEFTWGPDTLRLEIAPRDTGCTLTLSDTIDELGKAARDAAGWHACLDLLAAALDGGEPGFDAGARWTEVHPRYVERFGEEAATIGPPEGMAVGERREA